MGDRLIVRFFDIFQILIMRHPELMLKLHYLLGLFQQLITTQIRGDFFQINRTDSLYTVKGSLDLSRFECGFSLELGLLSLDRLDLTGEVGGFLVVGELQLFSGALILCWF